MTQSDAYKTVISAFFNGRGYFTTINQKLFGTEHRADVVAVLPIFRELQWRTQIGYAPCGILQYLPADGWVDVDYIVEKTGYDLAFVGRILEEAEERGWIELDLTGENPRCRNIKYHNSVRECICAFYGVEDFQKKLDMLEDYKGVFTQVYFIFPYPVDDETTQLLVSKGYGIIRYYENRGSFLEMIPADKEDVEDWPRYSVMAENVLFDNMWFRKDEII
ncbi:MAG: hypothetical protein HUJ66_01910 [Oscillospiraceae bacterium]|nr:hypothetical protein [Oscillospiraceae bacterium]